MLDVREGADYYGPDAPYKIMAGRDASKAFAMMSLKVEDAVSDLTGVPDNHLKILDDWYVPVCGGVVLCGHLAPHASCVCPRAAEQVR